MRRKIKNIVICLSVILLGLGVGTTIAHALPLRSNTSINLNGVASRPIIGNIFGNGFVETNTTVVNGVRVRVLVQSRNANGGVLGNNNSTWRSRTLASGALNLWEAAHVETHTGTARRGRVRLEGQRRLSASGSWAGDLSYERTWN
ncbi:MAG: hypothetical protein FWE07_01855 [Turicibacter sp.]|nr:hypothetical protein [Turicibacter sp.]